MGLFDSIRRLFGGTDERDSRRTDERSLGPTGGDGTDAETARADDGARAAADVESEFGPEAFRSHASEFVEHHDDVDLDYSVASLEALDGLATEDREVLASLQEAMEEDDAEELIERAHSGHTIEYGSYFGDVLVRAFDGEWERDADGWGVAVPTADGDVSVAVFDVAAQSVVGEPAFAEVAADAEDGFEDLARGTGEGVAAQAEALAAEWPDRELDFSPESLPRLDELVDEEWERDRFRGVEFGGESEAAATYADLVERLGSYYGEVFARNHDAEWTTRDDTGTAVEVSGRIEETVIVNAFHIAEDCLTEPSKFALNYDVVTDQLDVDAPSVHEGGGEVHRLDPEAAGDAAESVDPRDVVDGFADDAEDLVERWPDYDLDYSPASLVRLDELVGSEFEEFDVGDVELGDETDGDSLFLTAHALETGGYLAEVFRRHLGAEWRQDQDGELVLVVPGVDAEARLDPAGFAAACLRGEDSFTAAYEATRGQLSVDAPAADG